MKSIYLAAGLALTLHGLLFFLNADWLGGELVTVDMQKTLSMTMAYKYPTKTLPEPVAPPVPEKPTHPKKKEKAPKPEIPVKTAVPQAPPLPSKNETIVEEIPDSPPNEVYDHGSPDKSDTVILDHAPEGYESEPQDSPEKIEQTGINTVQRIVYPLAYEDNARPLYPMMARRRGYEGVVILNVLVSREGEVLEVRILETSGYSILDEEAKKAVNTFQFEPGKEDGVTTDMWVNIPIRFQLK